MSEALKNLYSIEDAAERLGVSRFTVRRLVYGSELKSVNVNSRRMIPRQELERVEQFGIGKPRQRKGAC